ncbi:hypothetical protein, partial [Klebsiella pneumoniae]|uniref:hypothetical protein n=1 Tax=Klebsiella pneumoniae TaxID=573 RepID=UPI003EDF2016
MAALSDARTLEIWRGEAPSMRVNYRRAGQWEFVRPWVSPDGHAVLVAVRDYTQPLDAFDLVVVD